MDDVVAAALACPHCRGPIDELRCGRCDITYSRRHGYIDFTAEPELGSGGEQLRRTDAMTAGLGPLRMRDPLNIERYEKHSRPAFLRIMGANWRNVVTEEDEVAYLHDHVDPADGPVLDLACGTGRWTRAVQATVGKRPVVGLDLSIAMLARARTQVPDVTLIRGSALTLPFGHATVGAVTCWNALQHIPEPRTVIGEVARCLRPGGTFTALTFRQAPDSTYRYFQRRHEDAFRVRSFALDTLRDWLLAAGLQLTHMWTPGTFLLFSATRSSAAPGG
jgi:SAM-dependent methyltransferase